MDIEKKLKLQNYMYCKNCEKYSPEGSNYCQYCGTKLFANQSVMETQQVNENVSTEFISNSTSPYPYVISLWKLFILSILTFGLFDIYWFYKQWKSFYSVNNQKHGWFHLSLISLFSGFSSFSLFKIIAKDVKEVDSGRKLKATWLAIAYLILNALSRLQGNYWLLSELSIFALLPVQNTINYYWSKKYGASVKKSNFGMWNALAVFIGIIIFTLIFRGGFYTANASTQAQNIATTKKASEQAANNKTENIFSVVKLQCDNGLAGSGTILTSSGLVITNNHVIAGASSCLVALANPQTGSLIGIYTANPLIVPNLSSLYDIAELNITGSYVDSNRKVWGVYPTTFPSYSKPNSCNYVAPKLGDPITVYGYPITSGGYNLTVTEGVVSSIQDNGDILTTAQIDSGNSGGLAINSQTGCMEGIPSAVQPGNYQSLGVIIPTSVLVDFLEKVQTQKLSLQPAQDESNPEIQNAQDASVSEAPSVSTSPSTDPDIDCTGPDGKHFQTTQQECNSFNAAWAPTPTPNPDGYSDFGF